MSAGRPEPTAEGPPGDGSPFSESDGPDAPLVETPSPPAATYDASPTSASPGLRLFHWSGGSSSSRPSTAAKSPPGLGALQQFQYKRERSSSLQTTCLDSCSPERTSELGDSPPSQDSAYFSQSQSTSFHQEEVLPDSGSASPQEETQMNWSAEPAPESHASFTEACRKPGLLGSKVSGLSKLKSSARHEAANSPALGPARASGLRKKRKGTSTNNENNPAVQATLSSLWRNFSYTKETPKISCSKKEPMSPVKDNLLITQPT